MNDMEKTLNYLTTKAKEIGTLLDQHNAQAGVLSSAIEKMATQKAASLRNVDFLAGVLHMAKDLGAFLSGNPLPLVNDALNALIPDKAETIPAIETKGE